MHSSTPGFRLSRRRLLVTAAALGAASVAGTRPLFAASRPKPSGQAIIGFSQEPTVFDPRLAHIEVDDGV